MHHFYFAATFIFTYVKKHAKEEKTVTWSAYFCDEDYAEFAEKFMIESYFLVPKCFVFPGVMALKDGIEPCGANKVTFTITTKVFEHEGVAYVPRLIASVKTIDGSNIELVKGPLTIDKMSGH